MKPRIIFLLLILQIFTGVLSYAQTFKFPVSDASFLLNGETLSAIPAGTGSITAYCNQWGLLVPASPDWHQDYKFKSCTDYVEFKIDEQFARTHHATVIDYTYRLTYHLIGYTNPRDTVSAAYQVTNDDTLTISYNSSSSNQPYQNINVKKYSGFYKMTVSTLTIYSDVAGTLIPVDLSDQAYRNFNVEARILTQQYDKRQYGTGGTATLPTVTTTPSSTNNYLDVSWLLTPADVAPTNYELEWTYVDDYGVSVSSGSSSPVPSGSLSYNFNHNSTRVWLDDNHYKIPLTYAHGYLVYRVRAVRPDSNLFKYPVYGDWSGSGSAPLADVGSVSSVPSTQVYQITNSYTNDSLNWQYTISFAEGGRYKHVGSFFDGLLKNRQSITRFNSDLARLIVTNNIYDYEGRACIKTLPAPVASSGFKYQHNVDLNSITLHPYKAQDFDSGLAICANRLIAPLAPLSLAAYYYSPLNVPSPATPWQGYVPDAEGYPLIQTVFEAGYADRVKYQGGAGPKLQVGDSNYLSNAYVGAGQKALNSLFGFNVGWNSFYNMTVSRDANKQLSMSVKDYEGHQVATALIGKGPDSSDHAIITDNLPASQRFNHDLLLPASPNQAIDTLNGTRTADADYFNEDAGDDSLQYEYTLLPYPVCGTQNIAVKAHLKSYVTDQCGNQIINHETTLGNNGIVASASINYSALVGFFSADIAPYHVHKKLSYYPSDINDAVDSFMIRGNCFRTQEDFVRSSVTSTIFPCTPTENIDSDACSKMKWDMMQQLFPGAVYGQYHYEGPKLVGSDNSIFTIECGIRTNHVPHTVHLTKHKTCFNADGCGQLQYWGFGHSGDGTSPIVHTTYSAASNFNSIRLRDTCVAASVGSFWGDVEAQLTCALLRPDSMFATYGIGSTVCTSSVISGTLNVITTSANLAGDVGPIRSAPSGGGSIIGYLSYSSSYPVLRFPATVTGSMLTMGISGYLPSNAEIHIDLNATINHIDSTYIVDSTYTVDSLGGIDTNNCWCRYQDTCTVPSLKDTITVAGVLYHGLRSMSADSFRMVYNAAIAAGNYSIAEALLPLHPQYCELQNCFVDTFKKQVIAIPNWRVAQSLGLLLLDSLVAHDPLRTVMASSGLFPSPTDSLKLFPGVHLRLDSPILVNAYCGCGDNEMKTQCTSSMFAYEISHYLLVNDEVKDYYFNNIVNVYFANRQNIINKLFFRGGTSCVHCAMSRMELDTATAVPPVPYSTDYTHYSDSSFVGPHSGWFSHIGTIDTASLRDSAIVFSSYIDTIMGHRSIDSIVAHLTNCSAGYATISAAIRSNLLSTYNSGAAPMGNFTTSQILEAIVDGGGTLSDICNPYTISATQFGGTNPLAVHDCGSLAYYRSIDTFMNNGSVTLALHALTSQLITLDSNNHNFHRLVARGIGNYSISRIYPSYDATRHLYEIDAVATATFGAGDTVKIFLHSPDCGNFFNTSGTYTFSTSCINSNPAMAAATGLVNEYSFIATVTRVGSPSVTCTMLGWVDSIQSMGFSDNLLADCVPCTQMKTLYKQFNDSMAHYGVNGADHPLYGTMLANFMNSKLVKQFAADDYERFIQSCAFADSLPIKLYNAGYATFTFGSVWQMNTFITNINAVDGAYSFAHSFRDSVSTGMRVSVNLNNIPPAKLYEYQSFLYNYGGVVPATYFVSRSLNAPFVLSAPASGTEAGFLYYDATTFSPVDSAIITDTTYVKFRPLADRGIWQTDHFENKQLYNIVAVAGAPQWAISRAMFQLENYFRMYGIGGAVFIPCYQHTVGNDYFKPQKQAYLNYEYGYQPLPVYQVLDSLKAGYLTARIPSYSGYLPGYAPAPDDAGTFTNLYLANAGMNNRYYDTMQRILSLAAGTGTAGYIFPAAVSTSPYSHGPMDLDVFRNSDGTYWYRYFTTGDSLFNVYVSIPAYIPKGARPLYHVVSITPTPGDSLNRCFTLGLQKGSDPTTIYATGRADFVLSKSIQLDKTLLGMYKDSAYGTPQDTFNNCERSNLLAAVNTGIFNYNNYRDSIKHAVSGNLRAYLASNTKEKLILSYLNHEFNLTLYNYDRAGNLVSTVPPAGSMPISPVGTALDDVDVARLNNTPGTSPMPVYNKINTYSYNSWDQVQQQVTIDGGKTRFFYDNAGRMLFSQNAKQGLDGYYTYNIYDQQNRLTETGEAQLGCTYFDAHTIAGTYGGGSTIPFCHYTYSIVVPMSGGFSSIGYLASPDPAVIYNLNSTPYDSVIKFIRLNNRRDVVMTFYDTVAKDLSAIVGLDGQNNLRKRVSCVKYFETLTPVDKAYNTYSYATHYSYDMEGNVNTLVQDFPDLYAVKQQYKRVDYDYDLISGKVNMLSYNRGWPDQFYHKYEYDADNRLTQVTTSSDGIIWDQDANYYYYQHGPLARVELGDLTVQGIDYAYTVQGWLKTVNNDSLNTAMDMGTDGYNDNPFAKDAVAYAIDYFKDDYKPVNSAVMQHTAPVAHSLYNGNIARQTMAINDFQRLNKQYAYDQLNRIRSAGYSSVNAADYSLGSIPDYHNNYTYDADGNLQTLNRYGNHTSSGTHLMDSLVYMYEPTGTNNKLQSVLDLSADMTDNALTPFNDATAQRYNYDAIGNTVKDLVSGQDTIRWNLYNKVKGTQNNTAHNTMQFRYDGAGNRVAKYLSVSTDSGTVQNNNYYVHDAQGNILATYNEKTRFTMEPLSFVLLAHRGLRSAVGGTEAFNNLFITPEFGRMAEFQDQLLAMSEDDSDFTAHRLDHPVSYFLSSTGRVKDFIFSDPSYLPPLVAADIASTAPVLPPAFVNYMANGHDKDLDVILNLAFADSALRRHTLGLLCRAHNGDSVLWQIHHYYKAEQKAIAAQHLLDSLASLPTGDSTGYGDTTEHTDTAGYSDTTSHTFGSTPPDSTGYGDSTSHGDSTSYTDSTAAADSSDHPLDCHHQLHKVMRDHIETSELAGLVVKFAGQYGAFDDWVGLMSTDSLLYKDDGSGSGDPSKPDAANGKDPTAYKGGTGKAMAAMAMNALAQYDDGWGNLLAFLDTWAGAGLIVDGIFTTDDKLRTVFNNDPVAYVNAFDASFGDDAIDSAVAALPRLSYLTHLSTAAVDLGIGLSSTLQLVTVVKDKQFDLATHDMYGSSRLGVKSYSPRQVGLGYTQAGGFTDTARLWTRRPWYSLQYQEIINQDSLNLYGNIHKDMYYTQHTRGLKQYELTDHLGDVLATLSDKRATNEYGTVSAGLDTITNYKPVVASAYDYYPFGQYMPGRYTEDTSSYCYTTTLTEMVTVVTQVPLVFSAGLRTVNNSATGAGPDVRPTDDGGILIGIDGGDAGTGTGVSWPIGTLGGGGTTEPGDPIGGSGGGSGGVGGGTTPIEGDVLVTATVSTGVFNVSVTDDNTGIDIGNVLVSSSDGTIIIKTHYTGVDGHSTSVHITLDHGNGAVDTNIIRVVTITVPHYTTVPTSVVSRVCSEESYRYGFNGKYKDNEWAGKGNHLDYGFRGYDARIARFSSDDPLGLKFPMLSSYQYASLNPIYNIDLDGAEGEPAPGQSFSQIAFNAMNGKQSEIMFKTKFSVAKDYDIFEQITYRPGGMGAASNTRADFFLKSRTTGNLYGLDIKTGNAVSSPNQAAAEAAVENGETMEMRTTKGNGFGVRKGASFKLGGTVKIRVDLKTGLIKIESIKTNPGVKGSEEILNLPEQIKSVKVPIKVETSIPEGGTSEEPTIPEGNTPIEPEAPIEPMGPMEPIEPIIPGL